MATDPAARATGQLKTFGAVVLIWSILAAVLSVLMGLNTVVGFMLQPQYNPGMTGPGAQQFQFTQQMSQTIAYVLLGLSLVWTVSLAILGFRLGPALGRLEPVRRWGLVWCALNLVICPFGTGIGIWGLVLLTRPAVVAVLEGGGGGPVGVEL